MPDADDGAAHEHGRKRADLPIAHVDPWLQRPGCFVRPARRDATDGQPRPAFDPQGPAAEDAHHRHRRCGCEPEHLRRGAASGATG